MLARADEDFTPTRRSPPSTTGPSGPPRPRSSARPSRRAGAAPPGRALVCRRRGMPTSEAAVFFGLSANATAALANRPLGSCATRIPPGACLGDRRRRLLQPVRASSGRTVRDRCRRGTRRRSRRTWSPATSAGSCSPSSPTSATGCAPSSRRSSWAAPHAALALAGRPRPRSPRPSGRSAGSGSPAGAGSPAAASPSPRRSRPPSRSAAPRSRSRPRPARARRRRGGDAVASAGRHRRAPPSTAAPDTTAQTTPDRS